MNSEIEKAQAEAIKAIQRSQQDFMIPTELTPEQKEQLEEMQKKENAMSEDQVCLLNILRLGGMPNAEDVVLHTPKTEFTNLCCSILTKQIQNIDICTSCCLFISDMLRKGSIKTLNKLNLDAMIQTLNAHPTNVVVTKHVLSILGNVISTRDRDTRTFIGRQIEIIVETSKRFVTDIDIQRGCCFIFSGVVDIARSDLEKVGGIDIALNLMQKFASDPSIQHNCCYILACMALDSSNKKIIGIRDGIQFIVSAMKRFNDNVRIQSYAAYALANLAHDNNDNSSRIRVAGGINALVDALKRFPEDSQAQSNICYAMFTLSEDSAHNTKRMGDLDVPSLILTSIRTHSKFQPDVASNGANALTNIFSEIPAKISSFIEAGGVDAVVQAMTDAATILDTQKACLGLLIILSQSESDSVRVNMCNSAAGAIVAAMKNFVTDVEVQMNSLILVSGLIMNCPENQTKFGSKDVVKAILTSMRANTKVLEIQQSALRALTNLVFKSVSNKSKVVKEDGIKTICDTMKAYDPSKVSFDLPRKSEFLSLQSTACMALINTCENSSEAQLSACACGCLETVLALAKSNRPIAKTCYSTIMILLSTPKAHAKYCTSKFIADVEGKGRNPSDSKDFQLCLATLKRIQDPRAEDAVKRGVCTNTNIPICKNPCPYKREKGYCVNCIGVQWVRYCVTCSKKSNEYLIYCPVCWDLHHKGHEGIKLFIPGRCECEEKNCHIEPAKKDTAAAEGVAPAAPASAAAAGDSTSAKPKVQQKKQPTAKKQPTNKKQQQQKKKAAKKK